MPMPPCGKPVEHLWWLEEMDLPCPRCARIAVLKSETEREDRLAEKIAEAVARKLNPTQ
ncbi:hypothetical protein H4CHR_02938 [Variovorax sp. PBS-H4]|uniref:hypothetical protein n=1 Tax=Variovorax sp. PBS-H4 TaxID=434008 RepID=UPI0013177E0E|nr:hypothetical protein [Variovorax sp. PBS-H4]VTU32081.1 hypothetical protein H4CHR_02938 [Variovorax sp. PBS-H4]